MNLNKIVKLSESIGKAFPNANIKKWVTEDDHEDIILHNDEFHIHLKVYPKLENISE